MDGVKEGRWMEGREEGRKMDGRKGGRKEDGWMDGRKFYTCWTDKSQQYLPENIYSPSAITVFVAF